MDHAHVAKRPRLGERTLLACLECKQRKLKCDGQSPKCQTCVKAERECLVEDPATGLHRPRNYIQTLESRVAYLESLLQNARPDVATDHLDVLRSATEQTQINPPNLPQRDSPRGSPTMRRPNAALSHRTPSGDLHSRRETAEPQAALASTRADIEVDDLSSEVAMLCLSAAGREPHYFGASSAVSFSRIASQAMGLPQRIVPSETHHIDNVVKCTTRNHQVTPLRLPNLEVAYALSNAYFSNIHPQYPFLHQPSFRAMEKEVLLASQNDALSDINEKSLFFVLMVYAIGSLVVGSVHHSNAGNYYTMALDRIASVLETDSLESIQGLLCCAVYSIRSPVGASLWKITGMAIRHCIELGYHRSVKRYRRTADELTKEMSKRCFWVAYDIDRVVCNILGRPDGIADHVIDVELPLDINDECITSAGLLENPRNSGDQHCTNMSGAIHVIKLRRLWSRISTELYSWPLWSGSDGPALQELSTEALRKELEDWRATTPEQTDSIASRPLSVFASHEWFQLGYDHSILLLYRPYITDIAQFDKDPSQPVTNSSAMTERAFRECFAKAREMCILYRRLYNKPSIQYTWGSLHILFLGGLTYLYCLWHSKSIRESARPSDVVNTCMACTTVLVIIAERWQMASSYRDIWELLAEHTISMICGESSSNLQHQTNTGLPMQDGSTAMGSQLPLQDMVTNLQDEGSTQSQQMVQQLLQCMPDFQGTGSQNKADDLTYDFFEVAFGETQKWP